MSPVMRFGEFRFKPGVNTTIRRGQPGAVENPGNPPSGGVPVGGVPRFMGGLI